MKRYIFEDNNYELITDYKNGFEEEKVRERFTDYFKPYDYIIGDWSYGSLRLKGFYNSPKANKTNDFNKKDDYIKHNCSYDCRHFILKKV